jgi:hypothetical protein
MINIGTVSFKGFLVERFIAILLSKFIKEFKNGPGISEYTKL